MTAFFISWLLLSLSLSSFASRAVLGANSNEVNDYLECLFSDEDPSPSLSRYHSICHDDATGDDNTSVIDDHAAIEEFYVSDDESLCDFKPDSAIFGEEYDGFNPGSDSENYSPMTVTSNSSAIISDIRNLFKSKHLAETGQDRERIIWRNLYFQSLRLPEGIDHSSRLVKCAPGRKLLYSNYYRSWFFRSAAELKLLAPYFDALMEGLKPAPECYLDDSEGRARYEMFAELMNRSQVEKNFNWAAEVEKVLESESTDVLSDDSVEGVDGVPMPKSLTFSLSDHDSDMEVEDDSAVGTIQSRKRKLGNPVDGRVGKAAKR